MSLVVDKRLFSIEEYHKMAEVGILAEKGIELIRGEIINMSPIGSRHAICVDILAQILILNLKGQYLVRVQNPIQLNDLSEPEPDISILKPKIASYFTQHPQAQDVIMIIEVADSSLNYDREVKGKLYAEAGITEYCIVNLEMQIFEMYRSPQPEEYTIKEQVKKGETLYLNTLDLKINTGEVLGD